MKFQVESCDVIGQQQLVYLDDECSFYTGGTVIKTDMELTINKISLAVFNDRIVDVNGFCGFDDSMKSDYEAPDFTKGIVKVQHDLQFGLAYGVTQEDVPVHVNMKTSWVCIGDPEGSYRAVEFVKNCVFVVGNDDTFVALWLKPQSLPKVLLGS